MGNGPVEKADGRFELPGPPARLGGLTPATRSIRSCERHVVLKEAVPNKVAMQIDIITSENVDFYRS